MNEMSKFARYRARKKAQGLRELRMWVPDVRNPEVQARLNRQIDAINRSADSRRVQVEIDSSIDESWKELD